MVVSVAGVKIYPRESAFTRVLAAGIQCIVHLKIDSMALAGGL